MFLARTFTFQWASSRIFIVILNKWIMVIGLKELPKEIDIYQILRTVHLRTG
jgi:hypothetical protein